MVKLERLIKTFHARRLKEKLGANTFGLIVRSENGFFAVDPEDNGVGKQLRLHGSYGLLEIEQLKPFIRPESRVLIVGAHIGALAIPLAKLCKELVGIEANPKTFEFLSKNVLLNSSTNCQLHNIAASDKKEQINFLLSRVNSGGSKRSPLIKDFMYYYDKPEEISVTAHSLDQFLADKDFDVILMDIEGSEYFALRGMKEILSNAKVLVVEFLPHHLRNVAGCSVAEFVGTIAPFFNHLFIPSKGTHHDAGGILPALQSMFDRGEGDDGIVFTTV